MLFVMEVSTGGNVLAYLASPYLTRSDTPVGAGPSYHLFAPEMSAKASNCFAYSFAAPQDS